MLLGELFLNEQIRYYKGKHEVKVLTQSKGYWTVAALEDFEDSIGSDSKVKVKAGETRIVPSSILLKAKKVPAPICRMISPICWVIPPYAPALDHKPILTPFL